MASLVSSRDAVVFDSHGAGIPACEFLRRRHEDESDRIFAVIRLAVVLGDNERVVAQLLWLPNPAAVLKGNQP